MHFVRICPNFHFWLHCEVLLNSFFLNFFSKLYYDVNCRKKVTTSQAQGWTLFFINVHTFNHLFKIGRNICSLLSYLHLNLVHKSWYLLLQWLPIQTQSMYLSLKSATYLKSNLFVNAVETWIGLSKI